ncbi:MAG: hypothetical protein CMJ75_15215 [Planctomycetaceae bacterium]|nr:hypothetical protein [Planctomycetaceae bacterium]
MRISTLTLVLGAICGGLMVQLAAAAEPVRAYRDPGYHRIGVYAGGPPLYFDYSLTKLPLGDTFPNKRGFWEERRALSEHAERPSADWLHSVFVVYAGIRNGDTFEVCRDRVDAWLKPEPGIPTYPRTIPAICLEEENLGSRAALMDRLARHIRDHYGIPVFQWYSDPLGPDTAVTADGWIWDSYGWDPQAFRRHAMRFVLLGKPAICVPWASDPHWPQWTRYPTTTDLINREWHQFATCLEFNVSTAPFCVAGPGALNPWLSSATPDMIQLRRALRAKRRAMHALPRGSLPLPTAQFSAADRSISVGGDPGSPSVYRDDFRSGTIVSDATIQGFLDLQLSSLPHPPGFLVIRPRPTATETVVQRAVATSLTYRLHSYFPLRKVKVRLAATAPLELGAQNTITLQQPGGGPDSEPLRVVRSVTGGDGEGQRSASLQLHAGTELLQGAQDLLVTLRMTQQRGDSGNLAHRLDQLIIECEHQPPAPGGAAELVQDDYGNLTYQDDFTTARWRHFGAFSTQQPTHAGFREGTFWVGLKGGYPVTATALQRFSSPRPLQQLRVTLDCYANAPDLGGTLVLQIAPRDQAALWSIESSPRHHGPLILDIPAEALQGAAAKVPAGLTAFDVRVVLRSLSGVEGGDRACASFGRLSIHAR